MKDAVGQHYGANQISDIFTLNIRCEYGFVSVLAFCYWFFFHLAGGINVLSSIEELI